jgi:hypothetical protein
MKKKKKAVKIPDSVVRSLAAPLVAIVGEFMARPGTMEKYRAWYKAQMEAGNPLGLAIEAFDTQGGEI